MQLDIDYTLTEFEQATLEQLSGGDCKCISNIKYINEAKRLVHKWSVIRRDKGLKPLN